MNASIRSTLQEFVDSVDREVAATPIDAHDEAARVAARAVRRRAIRVVGTTLVAAAVVTGVAVSVQALAGPAPVPPASPEPTDQSPTPTPPVTPTQVPVDPATPAVPQRTVTVDPLLPTALPLTEDVVRASAEPGWVLAGYDAVSDAASFHMIYLISPEGVRYEIPWRLPTTTGGTTNRIVDWLPGTSLVVVEEMGETTTLQAFDVMAGVPVSAVFGNNGAYYFPDVRLATPDSLIATRATATGDHAEELVRMSFDGTILDVSAGASLYRPWGLSPSRALVLDREHGRVLTTVGLEPVALPALPADRVQGECWPLQWLSDEEVVIQCGIRADEDGQPAPNGQHWRVRLDGSLIEPFTAPTELQLTNVAREFWLVDGVLYGMVHAQDEATCGLRSTLVQVTDGRAVPTAVPPLGSIIGLTGGRLIADTGPCGGQDLIAVDPATGSATTLLQGGQSPYAGATAVFVRDTWW